MRDHSDIQDTYDRVADEYVRRIFHELDGKPFDREILNRFAQRVRGLGPVHDLGCGPGNST
ncbi:MAG: class I SAM-dependent methyltransferase, partial [Byssovorax sp.]